MSNQTQNSIIKLKQMQTESTRAKQSQTKWNKRNQSQIYSNWTIQSQTELKRVKQCQFIQSHKEAYRVIESYRVIQCYTESYWEAYAPKNQLLSYLTDRIRQLIVKEISQIFNKKSIKIRIYFLELVQLFWWLLSTINQDILLSYYQHFIYFDLYLLFMFQSPV